MTLLGIELRYVVAGVLLALALVAFLHAGRLWERHHGHAARVRVDCTQETRLPMAVYSTFVREAVQQAVANGAGSKARSEAEAKLELASVIQAAEWAEELLGDVAKTKAIAAAKAPPPSQVTTQPAPAE